MLSSWLKVKSEEGANKHKVLCCGGSFLFFRIGDGILLKVQRIAVSTLSAFILSFLNFFFF